MTVDVLVLNYNGRHLLETCLPSVVTAAERASFPTQVWVIDNASTDDSLAWVRMHFPEVAIIRQPNLGLCSFNHVLSRLPSQFAVLLNNDLELEPECLDALLEPLFEAGNDCLMTAGKLLRPDGKTYEGQKTAVAWRLGLVQATSLFAGHESGIDTPSFSASAGAFLAVDRERFLQLGGFDPVYLPGRLEDLDLAYRGYLCGYQVKYVPKAIALHQGAASWNQTFGVQQTHAIALRNTLLFQWLRLRHPKHIAYQAVTLPLRMLWEVAKTSFVSQEQRFPLCKAVFSAVAHYRQVCKSSVPMSRSLRREALFFRQFSPKSLTRRTSDSVQQPTSTTSNVKPPHRTLKSKQHVTS